MPCTFCVSSHQNSPWICASREAVLPNPLFVLHCRSRSRPRNEVTGWVGPWHAANGSGGTVKLVRVREARDLSIEPWGLGLREIAVCAELRRLMPVYRWAHASPRLILVQ